VVCAVKFLSLLDIANVLLRSFVSSVVIALRSVVQFLLDVVEEPVWVNNTQPCQLADGSLKLPTSWVGYGQDPALWVG